MLNPTVQVREQHGVSVAEFWDCLRLDPAPVRQLCRMYEALMPTGGLADLIVDFFGVDFAGSAALSGIVRLQKLCRKRGGRLVLCNLCPTVFEVFRLTRLVPLFTFVADRPTALAFLGAGPGPDDDLSSLTPYLIPKAKPRDGIDPGGSPPGGRTEP